jgi:diacylglycerol kinase (ATP)
MIHPLARSLGTPAFTAPPRHFCTVATLGFDSRVSRYVEQHRLPVKGTLAYLYSTLRILLGFQPVLLRLRGDFGVFEGRVTLAATGNTAFYGGAMRIAPGAKLDDGLFHLCIVGAVPRRTVLRILPKVFSGAHLAHPAVRMLTTRSLEIETPEGAEWICADGESICQTPARLEVRPGALRVQVASGCGLA